jgi:hypothetical protein
MTDVKQLPPMDVAVAVKPAGMADPSPIYSALEQWLRDNNYSALDGPMESYPKTAVASYAQMQTDIMIPVEKPAAVPASATQQPNPK